MRAHVLSVCLSSSLFVVLVCLSGTHARMSCSVRPQRTHARAPCPLRGADADGERVRLLLPSGGWFNAARVLWRYGVSSMMRQRQFVDNVLGQFLRIYSFLDAGVTFGSYATMLRAVGLHGLTQEQLADRMLAVGVSADVINELDAAVMRVSG